MGKNIVVKIFSVTKILRDNQFKMKSTKTAKQLESKQNILYITNFLMYLFYLILLTIFSIIQDNSTIFTDLIMSDYKYNFITWIEKIIKVFGLSDSSP